MARRSRYLHSAGASVQERQLLAVARLHKSRERLLHGVYWPKVITRSARQHGLLDPVRCHSLHNIGLVYLTPMNGLWLLPSTFLFVASGFWLVPCAFWLVRCALWLVSSGLWLVACGLWLLACGLWLVASGLCL
jgi:hypothetical protein